MMLLLFLPQCLSLLAPTTRGIIRHECRVARRASNRVGMARRTNVQESSLPYKDVITRTTIITASALLISPSLAFATADNPLVATKFPLEIFINTLSVFMLARIIISWYPKTDLTTMPYSIAVWPTEPLLEPVRSLVPPAFGVDVSPIVWLALLSFFREIFTGQQGILTLMEQQSFDEFPL